MMMIKQGTHILTITTREMGKLNAHSAQYNAWRIIERIDFIIYILVMCDYTFSSMQDIYNYTLSFHTNLLNYIFSNLLESHISSRIWSRKIAQLNKQFWYPPDYRIFLFMLTHAIQEHTDHFGTVNITEVKRWQNWTSDHYNPWRAQQNIRYINQGRWSVDLSKWWSTKKLRCDIWFYMLPWCTHC